MTNYKLFNDDNGNPVCINKIGTRLFIPFAEGNADYQEYLKWVAEGNTPEPADSL